MSFAQRKLVKKHFSITVYINLVHYFDDIRFRSMSTYPCDTASTSSVCHPRAHEVISQYVSTLYVATSSFTLLNIA